MSSCETRKIEGWRSRLEREIATARTEVWGARVTQLIEEAGVPIVINGDCRGWTGRSVRMVYHAERYEAQHKLRQLKYERRRWEWAARTDEQKQAFRDYRSLWRATHRAEINLGHAMWRAQNPQKIREYGKETYQRMMADPALLAKRHASQLAHRQRRRAEINARQIARRKSQSVEAIQQQKLQHAIYHQFIQLAGLRYSGGMGDSPPCKRSEAEPELSSWPTSDHDRGRFVSRNAKRAPRLDKQIEVNQ